MPARKRSSDGVQIDMTPMIDVVFQLLAFFLMTFSVVPQEGDFNVRMPLAGPGPRNSELAVPPLHVKLSAAPGGELSGIALNGAPVADFSALHERILQLVGNERGPGSIAEAGEVEFDCDPALNYRHVIDAVTAVSGHVEGNGKVVSLLEKIRLAPPRAM